MLNIPQSGIERSAFLDALEISRQDRERAKKQQGEDKNFARAIR